MRRAPWILVEKYRVSMPPDYVSRFGDDYGSFAIPSPKTGQTLRVLANAENEYSEGWEHVSVSLLNRTPNWPEMSYIKDLFWLEHETVMQLHVPAADHINRHPNCLHLWRPTRLSIPRPPGNLVG